MGLTGVTLASVSREFGGCATGLAGATLASVSREFGGCATGLAAGRDGVVGVGPSSADSTGSPTRPTEKLRVSGTIGAVGAVEAVGTGGDAGAAGDFEAVGTAGDFEAVGTGGDASGSRSSCGRFSLTRRTLPVGASPAGTTEGRRPYVCSASAPSVETARDDVPQYGQ